jgi:hypothetical protein
VAEKTVKIPKPKKEQILSWQRAGVSNWRLVWDKNSRDWTIKKLEDVPSASITYKEWQEGQTSYEAFTTGSTQMPSDITRRVRDTTDPLAGIVEEYGLQLTTDPQTGRTELKGFAIDPTTKKRSTTSLPHYIYLDSKNQIQISSDYDIIKKKAIDDLKSSGQLDILFQDLYNKKRISKDTFDSRDVSRSDFNAALLQSIEEYSKTVIGNRESGTTTQAPNFLNYLKGFGGAGGTGIDESDLPRREFQDISREQLNAFLDNIYLETIGRKPTEDQRRSKLKELNKIVKTGIVTTKTVKGGEVQFREKGGFDERQQALKLQEQLKAENPLEYERRQAFGFMDELQKVLGGGM